MNRFIAATFVAAMFSISLSAQNDTTRNYTLDESVVGATREKKALSGGSTGVWKVDVEALDNLPKLLGNTDLMGYARMLPGVQTTNEATSGINVEGCDNSHNLISLDGIPIYSPTHLFGLVSSFNSSHFKTMNLDPQSSVSEASRIGAHMSLGSETEQPDKLKLNASVGIISSQGSIDIPMGKKSSLNLSARASYVGWVTKLASKISEDTDELKYRFFDVNANWRFKPSDNDRLRLLYFYGHDKASFGNEGLLVDGLFTWGNQLGGFEWKHDFDNGSLNQLAYATNYGSAIDGSQSESLGNLFCNITDVGYKIGRNCGYGRWSFDYGAGYIFHMIHPQEMSYSGDMEMNGARIDTEHSHEVYTYFKASTYLGEKVTLGMGGRATGYYYDKFRFAFDPQVNLSITPMKDMRLIIAAGVHHQFLHQASYSGIGLPIDYWVSASEKLPQQRAESISVKLTQSILNNMYEFSLQSYGRLLHNQVELNGSPWQLMTEDVNSEEQLMCGKGYAYGVSAMAQKKKCRFTGWISYTWGHSMRHFDDIGEGYYPSCHEREHDLKALACWRINDKWSVSGTYVFASGQPCSERVSAYIIDETIVCEYGPYNQSRLPNYMRLDVSATYRLPARKIDHGLDLSLCNLLFNENVLCYGVRFVGMEYRLKRVCFLDFCIPSINYYIKF